MKRADISIFFTHTLIPDFFYRPKSIVIWILLLWSWIAYENCVATYMLNSEPKPDKLVTHKIFREENVQYPERQSAAIDLLFFKPMDVNRVTLEELVLLPGIGPVTASKILDFREKSGFIITIDEFDSLYATFSFSRLATVKKFLR